MRILELVGKIVAYIVMAIFIIAGAVVDLYIVSRYGLFALIVVVPLSLMLIGLLFSIGMMVIVGLSVGIAKAFGALFGFRDSESGD